MERLTRINELGVIIVESSSYMAVIKKLAAYEDIGLTPEQLIEIDKLYAEKCKELAECKKAAAHKPITNGDKIRAMSDHKLAEFMYNITNFCFMAGEREADCEKCPLNDCGDCSEEKSFYKWIQKEVR